MSTEAHAFNCPTCGAGFDILGGGRTKVHVCSYCGSELDVQDSFKVLAQFRDMTRPVTPFDLGMTGTLWGAEFTAIGTMAWEERHEGKIWTWVDHQIFSPTHGYAWLTVEDGFVTFARKARAVPSPAQVSERTVEKSENRPTVRLGRTTYVYYSSGQAQPTFIEGAFNYAPTTDERIRYVTLVGSDDLLDIVEGQQETEYELSSLPDQSETLLSFGVAPERLPKPRGVHPLQKVSRSPLQLFARNLFLASAVVAMILAIGFWFAGQDIAKSGREPITKSLSVPFTVTVANRLTEIEVWANAANSWAWFEAELLNADGGVIAEYEDGVAYYSGYDGGENWTEGSRSVKTRIALPPGDYLLEIGHSESEIDWKDGRLASIYEVRVRQGVMNAWWMIGIMSLLALMGGAFLLGRIWHHMRRWAGSDWSDD